MPSNHLILYHLLLLLPSIFLSIRVLSNESVLCIRWPKYWSFSFSISPHNEYSVLLSFRMDWFDLLAVQRTLKSLVRPHSSKSISSSAFSFLGALTLTSIHDSWKTTALTRQACVGKVTSLLFFFFNLFYFIFSSLVFNMLSRIAIAFLPKSKSLLISWLQSPSAVILEPKKIKFLTFPIVSPSICHELMDQMFHDLHFLNVEF